MAEVTLRGNPLHTSGDLPAVGSKAPAFELVGADLGAVKNDTFAGKTVVLNIFPSVDTPTCAQSVRQFNARAAELGDAAVICVSEDLPFAATRFCGAEGLENVVTGSGFRSDFATDYGVRLVDGPLTGLMARAVVVINPAGEVTYTELVPEIAQEPNYDAALDAIN